MVSSHNSVRGLGVCCDGFLTGECEHGTLCECGWLRAPWPWTHYRPTTSQGGSFAIATVIVVLSAWQSCTVAMMTILLNHLCCGRIVVIIVVFHAHILFACHHTQTTYRSCHLILIRVLYMACSSTQLNMCFGPLHLICVINSSGVFPVPFYNYTIHKYPPQTV